MEIQWDIIGGEGLQFFGKMSASISHEIKNVLAIINENGLNTADVKNVELIEKHMVGFFFEEGDYGHAPAGFQAGGGK